MCRGCHFSHTGVGNVKDVCPSKFPEMCVVPLLPWEPGLQLWAAKCFLVAAVFFRGCMLLKCLSLLDLLGYCKATWNDSWVWQMSGTAGCVLDYPKSLDNAVIHHCPNYLCIDCRSLCDSIVMANYPGYLWYLLDSALEEFKKMSESEEEKRKELEQKHTSESNVLIHSKTIYALLYMRLYCMGYLYSACPLKMVRFPTK